MHGLFLGEVPFLSTHSPCFLPLYIFLFSFSVFCSHLDHSFLLPGGQFICFLLSLIFLDFNFLKFSPISATFYLSFFELFVCIWVPPVYLSIRVLHFSPSFILLQQRSIGLCLSLNCWSPWNILCIFKHSSVSNSYPLHFSSLHTILISKRSAIFFVCMSSPKLYMLFLFSSTYIGFPDESSFITLYRFMQVSSVVPASVLSFPECSSIVPIFFFFYFLFHVVSDVNYSVVLEILFCI